MLKNYNLTFNKGSILTGELLHKMYSVPKELTELAFVDYSDGVISGLNFSVKDNRLWLSKGLYKHKGNLYLQEADEELEIPGGEFEENIKYKVILSEDNNATEGENVSLNALCFKIVEASLEVSKDLTICSFTGVPRLLVNVKNITGDFNLLNYKHSAYGEEATFQPCIFKIISKELVKKLRDGVKLNNPLDYVFLQQIYSTGIVSVGFMREYINLAGVDKEDESRASLMKAFINATQLEGKKIEDNSKKEKKEPEAKKIFF